MGKKADWESWSQKFLSYGKHKRHRKLLVRSGFTSGVDEIPTLSKYENALKKGMDLDKKIINVCELNELAYEDLISSINTSSSVDKMAFGIVRKAKRADFL